MLETRPIGILAGPRGIGRSSQQAVALPFFQELIEGAVGDGCIEPSREQLRQWYDVPEELTEPEPFRPLMDAGVATGLAFGVSLFVAQSIGSAVIGRIINDIWEAKILPVLRKIRQSKEAQDASITAGGVRLDIWFGVERVGVVVLSDDADPDRISPLVREAVRRAESWLNDKGVTHRYLTYRIRNGELSRVPILSDEEP